MLPTLHNEDFVISLKSKRRQYKKGDIVVTCHAEFGHIIKRIEHIDENKRIALTGDNLISTGSKKIGLQEPESILGRVIWHIPTKRH